MEKKTVTDIDVRHKRVLLRVDYNVPLNKEREVSDDTRIVASLPTVNYLLSEGARVILCSHLGRPKGAFREEFSLKPVAKRLQELLPDVSIAFSGDCIGEEAAIKAMALKDGEILLLENLRFHAGEEKNDPEFARALASLGEVYVSDAFGTVHRAHASTEGVAKYLPAVAGFLIGKELSIMGGALENPKRPFVAVLGGAKVGDKIGVIRNLLLKCDSLLIGGAMAYTFFKAMGYGIGGSLLDADNLALAGDIIAEAKAHGTKLLLPVDTVVADRFAEDAAHQTVLSDAIPDDWIGMDIGARTAELFAGVIREAGTVIWNGPMGVFEFKPFSLGTAAIAEACAACKGVTIIGGGDSASAVKSMGFADRVTHVSTGGGASLEFLEGKVLPGIAALNDR